MSNSEVFWATGHGISRERLSGLSYVQNRLILSVTQNGRISIPSQRETYSVILSSM